MTLTKFRAKHVWTPEVNKLYFRNTESLNKVYNDFMITD